MKPHFGDLTWAMLQKFWSDFVPICFPDQIETFGKASVLILVGKITALIWVIWEASDTWTDPDFQVRFFLMVFPTDSTETL